MCFLRWLSTAKWINASWMSNKTPGFPSPELTVLITELSLFYFVPSKSLIFFARWHTLERKLGGLLCPALVRGCVMKVRDGRCICLQDRARDHGYWCGTGPFLSLSVGHWPKSHPFWALELLSQQLCQAPTCTSCCFLCKSQAKASCLFSTGLHVAWRGMPHAWPTRTWSRGALTFFSSDVRPCNDSIPSGANPKSLFDW